MDAADDDDSSLRALEGAEDADHALEASSLLANTAAAFALGLSSSERISNSASVLHGNDSSRCLSASWSSALTSPRTERDRDGEDEVTETEEEELVGEFVEDEAGGEEWERVAGGVRCRNARSHKV